MIVKLEAEDLPDKIVEQLKGWANGDLRQALNEAIQETAETGAKMLQKDGPYKSRMGKYAKGWQATLRKRRYSSITGLEQYSINNKTRYQLTHLLENGHVGRDGKRVKAFEHIKPVEEFMETLVVSNANKKLAGR